MVTPRGLFQWGRGSDSHQTYFFVLHSLPMAAWESLLFRNCTCRESVSLALVLEPSALGPMGINPFICLLMKRC